MTLKQLKPLMLMTASWNCYLPPIMPAVPLDVYRQVRESCLLWLAKERAAA